MEQPPGLRFPFDLAEIGLLDAVVDGVPHQMHQRIGDGFQHRLVEFRVAPLQLHFALLVALLGEISHDARVLSPGIANRLHARAHHAVLQRGGQPVEPLDRLRQFVVAAAGGNLHDPVAGQHQFADEIHQIVEMVDLHANERRTLRLGGLAADPADRPTFVVGLRTAGGGRGKLLT